uniref:RING-type E3 ubiquitin transferase n=1 Tax=Macrostomum lignano TaxID=282301 RepID=A0A1I8F6L8_9PLAT
MAAWHSSCSPIAAKSVGPSTATCPCRQTSSVSGHHCAVFKDPDGGVWLQDTSMNGTLVNGRRILGDVAELRQDDVITPMLPQHPHPPAASSSASGDPMEANLNCTICCEIFHDCVTLIPCLHGYCAGCYSPCRVRPERVTKNVLVTNLAEAYLAAHPERRRPAEELEKLDSLNDIGRQEAFPVVRQSPADETNPTKKMKTAMTDGNAGVALLWNEPAVRVRRAVPDLSAASVGDPTAFAARLPPVPGYQPPDPQPAAGRRCELPRGPPPVDGCPHLDESPMGAACKLLTCPDNQAHLLCQCCWQAFPDRRADPTRPAPARIADFQCALCQRFFCHAYWGCRRPGCLGCLAEFEDFTFGRPVCSRDVVNGKPVESSPTTSSPTIWAFATCSEIRPDTPVCYACGQACLRELALAYRSGLPAASLPAEAASRPNCHWGSECRTQFNKPEHAKRFNHACRRT